MIQPWMPTTSFFMRSAESAVSDLSAAGILFRAIDHRVVVRQADHAGQAEGTARDGIRTAAAVGPCRGAGRGCDRR